MTAPAAPPPRAPISACPCCGGPLGAPFYKTGPVPVHSCLMLDSAEDAKGFPTAQVTLSACAACGFVTNTAFDPKWSAYAPNYEDQQSFSPTFNAFARRLAERLVSEHGLTGKTAVEIGCSKGDFMALLCEIGGMHSVGIDPAALSGRVAQPARGSMRFEPVYYGARHLDLPADLICCRHTLEHIRPVHDTLVLMRRHAEKTPGAVVCIEVPDAARIWAGGAFEDVYYEHCSYFTAGSLAGAMRRAGFAVTDLRRDYGDQYLVVEAVTDATRDRSFAIEETPAQTLSAIAAFSSSAAAAIDGWRDTITAARASGERIAIWGSGSKCVAFIHAMGAGLVPDRIIDINPHRHGKFAPAVPVPISAPQGLAQGGCDLIVVMNPVYRDEIARMCDEMGVTARLLALGQGESLGKPADA